MKRFGVHRREKNILNHDVFIVAHDRLHPHYPFNIIINNHYMAMGQSLLEPKKVSEHPNKD